MKMVECEFEADVLAAALLSGWPETADTRIRDHVSRCAGCSELAAVVCAVDELRESTAGVTLPDAGRVWWLAQLRARREAAAAARRPIAAIQIVAFVCAACVVGSLVASADVAAIVAAHTLIAAGLAAMLLLVPAAVFLAVGRD